MDIQYCNYYGHRHGEAQGSLWSLGYSPPAFLPSLLSHPIFSPFLLSRWCQVSTYPLLLQQLTVTLTYFCLMSVLLVFLFILPPEHSFSRDIPEWLGSGLWVLMFCGGSVYVRVCIYVCMCGHMCVHAQVYTQPVWLLPWVSGHCDSFCSMLWSSSFSIILPPHEGNESCVSIQLQLRSEAKTLNPGPAPLCLLNYLAISRLDSLSFSGFVNVTWMLWLVIA